MKKNNTLSSPRLSSPSLSSSTISSYDSDVNLDKNVFCELKQKNNSEIKHKKHKRHKPYKKNDSETSEIKHKKNDSETSEIKHKKNKNVINIYSKLDDTFIKPHNTVPFNLNFLKGDTGPPGIGKRGPRGRIGHDGPIGPRGYIGPIGIGKRGMSGRSLRWKGIWCDKIFYKKNDIINYDGIIFIAINSNININPLIEQYDWDIMIDKCLSWKGTWNNTITYSINNLVFYNGSTYICIIPNIDVVPDSDSSKWNIYAQGIPIQPIIQPIIIPSQLTPPVQLIQMTEVSQIIEPIQSVQMTEQVQPVQPTQQVQPTQPVQPSTQ
jgi:hypothetical protein